MKQTVKTSRAAGQLEKMFRELNKHYFAGKLPEPIISLKKTPSAYGHITCSKVWQAGGENKYEINISSATLDRPIEETASTLLHEMVHEHCMETGIKDTSNNGVYHNGKFKAQAEAHGLTVDHTKSTAGPSRTRPRSCWTLSSSKAGRISRWVSGWHGRRWQAPEQAARHPAAVRPAHRNLPRQRAAPGGGYAPSVVPSSGAPRTCGSSARTAWSCS